MWRYHHTEVADIVLPSANETVDVTAMYIAERLRLYTTEIYSDHQS